MSVDSRADSQPRPAESTPPSSDVEAKSFPERAAEPIHPFDGIAVQLDIVHGNSVEIDAITPLEEGWLEQVACAPNTREHESLLVIEAKPSQVHAALLMAGFEPGSPGRWTYENKSFGAVDPIGEKLELFVRYPDETGADIEQSIRQWMRDPREPDRQPDQPWVFGGSSIQPNPPSMGPGEHYVADFSGSIIGIVTFGDEVIGYGRVLSDQDAVQDPSWEANPDTMPPPGTKVTLIIRKFEKAKR